MEKEKRIELASAKSPHYPVSAMLMNSENSQQWQAPVNEKKALFALAAAFMEVDEKSTL